MNARRKMRFYFLPRDFGFGLIYMHGNLDTVEFGIFLGPFFWLLDYGWGK